MYCLNVDKEGNVFDKCANRYFKLGDRVMVYVGYKTIEGTVHEIIPRGDEPPQINVKSPEFPEDYEGGPEDFLGAAGLCYFSDSPNINFAENDFPLNPLFEARFRRKPTLEEKAFIERISRN